MTREMVWFLATAFGLGLGFGAWYSGSVSWRRAWKHAVIAGLIVLGGGTVVVTAGMMANGFESAISNRSGEVAGMPVTLVLAAISAATVGIVPIAAGAALGIELRGLMRK